MAFPASILPGLVGPDSMLIVWVWFQEFRFWPLFNHPLLKPFVVCAFRCNLPNTSDPNIDVKQTVVQSWCRGGSCILEIEYGPRYWVENPESLLNTWFFAFVLNFILLGR